MCIWFKNQPYSEIIDLNSKFKEYQNICEGKHEKIRYYLEWKEDILKSFSKLDTPDKFTNFKHYLLYCKRYNHNIDKNNLTLLAFITTPILNQVVQSVKNTITDGYILNWFDGILFFISIFLSIGILIKTINEDGGKYSFYSDLLEIVEEIEKSSKEKE